MSVKGLSRVEIKDGDRGEVTAVFATLGVVDSDGDVTVKGAFPATDVVISAYGHASWSGAVPVGKGSISEVGAEAVLDGRFFMDTQAGRDTFTVVKELGGLQEWSYGYDALKESFGEHEGQRVRFLEELDVHEVSPVLKGAGVGTRVVSAKGARFGEHIDVVMAEVDELVSRAADVVALRASKGKGMSEASAERLATLEASLKRLSSLLRNDNSNDEGGRPAAVDDVRREFARYVALTNGVTAA